MRQKSEQPLRMPNPSFKKTSKGLNPKLEARQLGMNRNSRKKKLAAIALSTSVIAGCTTTTEQQVAKPECGIPPQPVLEQIKSKRLSCLSDEVYWSLMERERKIVDWALEMRATLNAVCAGGGS